MRMLTLSDIHGKVELVARLREREANDFDLIIVAGDIGGDKAEYICKILDTFACKVIYVYSNHDDNLDYNFKLGVNGHNLHLGSFICGQLCLVGFSGCPTNWGKNPIYKRLSEERKAILQTTFAHVLARIAEIDNMKSREQARMRSILEATQAFIDYDRFEGNFRKSVLDGNRNYLESQINEIDAVKYCNIAVTHEKITKLWTNSKININIFGHIHNFGLKKFQNQFLINTAALDKSISVVPMLGSDSDFEKIRNIPCGNYCIIEFRGRDMKRFTLKNFGYDMDGWEKSEGFSAPNAPFVGVDRSKDWQEDIKII